MRSRLFCSKLPKSWNYISIWCHEFILIFEFIVLTSQPKFPSSILIEFEKRHPSLSLTLLPKKKFFPHKTEASFLKVYNKFEVRTTFWTVLLNFIVLSISFYGEGQIEPFWNPPLWGGKMMTRWFKIFVSLITNSIKKSVPDDLNEWELLFLGLKTRLLLIGWFQKETLTTRG